MILREGVPCPDDSKILQDSANHLEELPSQLTLAPANKARWLNNDKIALLSFSSDISDDIPKGIDDINHLLEIFNLDCSS
jgi:hypothetical protein